VADTVRLTGDGTGIPPRFPSKRVRASLLRPVIIDTPAVRTASSTAAFVVGSPSVAMSARSRYSWSVAGSVSERIPAS